ncbi:hypothetical protein GNI_075050 [Gregarina niphandrodes]|uniref:Uncharacterized protein n=1 Tax=Gregarina niphandrodes TaxID=110365 RepID=A0A023B6X7_GRENI|nr:hypothetical protein GNI_075050 [Gregarina niphandrodes]EZG66845.1 hypothetical protein GNI_075050 [Gregarina niphandrodes]|eukprot:XP_011130467.1 hypothetical protein GNI_075050 [Gregarina niphandrodes]
MNDFDIANFEKLNTTSSYEAEDKVKNRLHQDLVYREYPVTSENNQIHHLASARGLTKYEFGPKSLDELRNEQMRLQKWGSKFAGANQVLKNELEALKAELQRAYEVDPLRSGQHVTKEAYDLLSHQYDVVKQELTKLQTEKGLASDHLHRLKLAKTQANEQR